jgi:hypothetical protein
MNHLKRLTQLTRCECDLSLVRGGIGNIGPIETYGDYGSVTIIDNSKTFTVGVKSPGNKRHLFGP